MLAAYLDLKKGFDTVHRKAILKVLRLREISARIISLLSGLHSETESTVNCTEGISNFLTMNMGVRQAWVQAPSLFITCMDRILSRDAAQSHCGARLLTCFCRWCSYPHWPYKGHGAGSQGTVRGESLGTSGFLAKIKVQVFGLFISVAEAI